MIKIEQRVIDIIRKLRNSVKNSEMSLAKFPIDDVISIIENTLGNSFWKCIGSKPQEAFQIVPQKYKELFTRCIEKNDVESCLALLDLFENQYKCFYMTLGRDEQMHREKNYRIIILNIGHALAKIQYWQHEERQKKWEGCNNFFERGKGAVYTCLLGGNEELYQPEYTNVFWDYICFTDKEEKWGTKQGVWEFRRLDNPEKLNQSLLFHQCKIKPYEILPEYDYSIWIDPQMQIIGELQKFYKYYGKKASFLAFSSYVSDSIYDAVHTSLTEDDANIAYRQKMLQYQTEGFPDHYGLISTSLIIRYHQDEELKAVMEAWWEETLECKSIREFAFNYVAWKRNYLFAISDLFVENNPYIRNMGLDLEVEITE